MSHTSGPRLGPYLFISPLGSGGMGEVYLAEDMRLDRKVALKLLPPALVSDEQAKKRLIREAKSAATLASAYDLVNKREEAVKWLEVTADEGLPCYPFFEKDANLNNMREDERFITFMSKLRKEWEELLNTL